MDILKNKKADREFVRKIEGKGLSTEDYTTEEKNKLAGLSEHDKGFFVNEAAIVAAIPAGQAGWFCRNGETDTVWVWDVEGSAWVDTGSTGASSNATIVEWLEGEDKPNIVAEMKFGTLKLGANLVQYKSIGEQLIAIVTPPNVFRNRLSNIDGVNFGNLHNVQDVRSAAIAEGSCFVVGDNLFGIINFDNAVYTAIPLPISATSVNYYYSLFTSQGIYASALDATTQQHYLIFLSFEGSPVIIEVSAGANHMFLDSDGKLLVSLGDSQLIRYNADLTIDSSFVSPFNDYVWQVAETADGNYLVCGNDIGLKKISKSNGAIDNSFVPDIPNANYSVNNFILTDSAIYVPGQVDTYPTAQHFDKLDLTGVKDQGFNFAALSDEQISLSIFDASRNRIFGFDGSGLFCLNASTGVVDQSFNLSADIENLVRIELWDSNYVCFCDGATDIAIIDETGAVVLTEMSYMDDLESRISILESLLVNP